MEFQLGSRLADPPAVSQARGRGRRFTVISAVCCEVLVRSMWPVVPLRRKSMNARRLRAAILDIRDSRLRLEGVRIIGSLDLARQDIRVDLELIDCDVEGGLVLSAVRGRTIDLSSSRIRSLRADAAEFDGDVVLTGSRIGNSPGRQYPLVDAPGQLPDVPSEPRRIRARQASAPVSLTDARISGNLVLEYAEFFGEEQWSLLGSQLRIGGSLQGASLTATGALYLRDARVEGSVLLDAARLGGLDATAITVNGGFYADWGFSSTGLVRLRGSSVSTIVTFHRALLRAPGGGLILTRLRTQRLRIDLAGPPHGLVTLRDAAIDSIVDGVDSWPASGSLDVEGLTYRRLSSTTKLEAVDRLRWLKRDDQAGGGSFEQLALSYQRAGDERAARVVRMARERHLRRRDRLPARVWGFLQDVLFGYGYAPGRALTWLVVLVGFGSMWFSVHPPEPSGQAGRPAWDAILYTIDLIIPIANLGYRTAWHPEQGDKAVAIGLILSGWLLATTVITGVARLLSRP